MPKAWNREQIKQAVATKRYCEHCESLLVRGQRGGRVEPLEFFAERQYCNAQCRTEARAARLGIPLPRKRDGYGAGPTQAQPRQIRVRPRGRRSARAPEIETASPVMPELDPDDWRRVVYGGVQIIGVDRKRYPPKAVRVRVAEKQNNTCLYCEIPIGTYIERRREVVRLVANWDHFVPYAYTARNAHANWVLACHVCNGIKAARVFDTVQQARLVILPAREAKGYESPLSVLARLAPETATGAQDGPSGAGRENAREEPSGGATVALRPSSRQRGPIAGMQLAAASDEGAAQ